MKANPWLIPGAALIVMGSWIFSQKRSIATLEREISVITEQLQFKIAGDSDSSHEADERKSGKEREGEIDWREIAGKLSQGRGGGVGDMRTFVRLRKLLLEMSSEELCDQLDQIAALDLNDSERAPLRGMILSVLVDKDPKLALERFSDEIGDEAFGSRWDLQRAMGKWAEADPAAAAAWLDGQIACGAFDSKSLDGKSQVLLGFESALVSQQLMSDPSAAAARVAALPDDQREDFFRQGVFGTVAPEKEGAYAKLVRDSLPADKAGEMLANVASNLAMRGGDYQRVDGFIARTDATDREKAAIVEKVIVGKMNQIVGLDINSEPLVSARSWGSAYSVEGVNSATGAVIGRQVVTSMSFEDASEMVLQLSESSGGDEVLASFLKSDGVRDMSPDKARLLIERIQNPSLRQEILALPEYKNPPSGP